MLAVYLVLLVAAVVCFGLAAFSNNANVRLVPLGLALFAAVPLLQTLVKLVN